MTLLHKGYSILHVCVWGEGCGSVGFGGGGGEVGRQQEAGMYMSVSLSETEYTLFSYEKRCG